MRRSTLAGDPFVRVLPFFVFLANIKRLAGFRRRFVLWQGVTANASRHHLIGNQQAGGKQSRFRTFELQAKPVVSQTAAHLAIVEVLDVIRSADDLQCVVIRGVTKSDRLRLLG